MILLWGLESDAPLAMVGEALDRRGAASYFLDQSAILRTRIRLDDQAPDRGAIEDGDRRVDLVAISGVYLRPFDTRRLPAVQAMPPESSAWIDAIGTDNAMLGWCEIAPARVLNRPGAMASNNSKPYQCALIEAHGFATPPSLVTNDIEAARAFRAEHGRVIYKSVSGVRSIVACLGDDAEDRFGDLAACPTQFQAWVPGVDVRVHVIGERVFATEIVSDADDYRYAARQEKSVSLRPIDLTDDTAQAFHRLTRGLGLEIAGVDLRRGPEGDWTCFEVNPSPGFSFYEHATGQPIAAAIAELLTCG